MSPRYLTKSLFKVAYECPTKLYYQIHKEYGNTKVDNAFLKALADGGFQVGELAKMYSPGGIEITEKNSDKAAEQTEVHLKKENVTLFEAALRVDGLLVRVDILHKRGNSIELVEVKAKSWDDTEESGFYKKAELKKGIRKIQGDWEPYLMDIAFQTYVAKKALPGCKISSYLMMADKTAKTTVDGINQRFLIVTDNKQTDVIVREGTKRDMLGDSVLISKCVDDEVEVLFNETFDEGRTFTQLVNHLLNLIATDTKDEPKICSSCKQCEFRLPTQDITPTHNSGFEECWLKATGLSLEKLRTPLVFDLWDNRKSKDLIEQRIYLMTDIQEEDLASKAKSKKKTDEGDIDPTAGLTRTARQWLQVEKTQKNDLTPYFDHIGLREEMSSWTYPLNFIDFETTMVAIPFHKGKRPYEQLAFQFSHHVMTANGKITHQSEFIHFEQGAFPNFDFVRALKKALTTNDGTIFRFAAHENTVLGQIMRQLEAAADTTPDHQELIDWIKEITQSSKDADVSWEGSRNMIDLCDLVKKFYYSPLTGGSNSIKKVLPAVLRESTYLQDKYSKPIYGTDIPSKNFKNHAWIKKDSEGKILDPYKTLEPIFSDLDLKTMDSLIKENSLADGGAAMTAFARMQFTEMSELERHRVSKALLRYCELDTFAMVMIVEYWIDVLKAHEGKDAA
ncbi:MAG: DUF2779 domain-containing protein [Methylotenera sp.]|nr:DUF2779 domain-containing protein [Oligoflexia bacterium]